MTEEEKAAALCRAGFLFNGRTEGGKNMRKVLPFYQFVNATYPHNAHALGILYSHVCFHPWLLNCFIQLEGWDTENMDYEDFWILECPLLTHQRISKKMIEKKWDSISDFLIEMLDEEQYIYLLLKTDVIPEYENYHGDVHDALIYGYDTDSRRFLTADFFRNGKYSTQEIPFEKIEKATEHFSEKEENHWIFTNDCITLRVSKKQEQTEISLPRVREALLCYLDGKPTKEWYHRSQRCYVQYPYQLIYGMDTYKILYSYAQTIREKQALLPHWRQVFHLWSEHKCNMLNRLCYIENSYGMFSGKNYADTYRYILKRTETVMLLMVKYNLTMDAGIADSVEKLIREVEMLERNTLNHVILQIPSQQTDRRGRMDW